MTDVPVLWWSARAMGFVGFAALLTSILSGLMISARGGGLMSVRTASDLHQEATLMALIAAALHGALIVVDPHADVSPLALLIPFASARLTVPVAFGTVALLGLGLLWGSSQLRVRIGPAVWRGLHASAFATWMLGGLHAAWAGSSEGVLLTGLYVGAAGLVIGLTLWRLGVTMPEAG